MKDGPASFRLQKRRASGCGGCGLCITAIVALAMVIAFSMASAYYESQTYNRLTGAHTTWFDALFVKLTVQDHAVSKDDAKQ